MEKFMDFNKIDTVYLCKGNNKYTIAKIIRFLF